MQFDPAHADLSPGITLIEASAGTGKTYCLTRLYVRFLLERGFKPSEVLAVTYTEAATAELKTRIRNLLREAAVALNEGQLPDYLSADGQALERRVLRLRLESALAEMDEAAISTIHGFCQRLLAEFPLESGTRLGATLLPDASAIEEEIARDWWRVHIMTSAAPVPQLAEKEDLSPDSLFKLFTSASQSSEATVQPACPEDSFERHAERLARIWKGLADGWNSGKPVVTGLLLGNKNLSRDKAKGFSEARLTHLTNALDALVSDPNTAPPSVIAAISAFSKEGIDETKLKKARPEDLPTHPFFDLCSEFVRVAGSFVLCAKHSFLNYAQGALADKKQQDGILTFDDQIQLTRRALRERQGFRNLVRSRYHAALVDEFQDTDPAQWEILRTLFDEASHSLFLIGDPKQAIYSFRGADVFAYLEARNAATRRHSLNINRRSVPGLVESIVASFSAEDAPFGTKEIQPEKVSACEAPPFQLKTKEGSVAAALEFCKVTGTNAEAVRNACARAAARDLVLLLRSGSTLNGRPIRPGDCAVITRRNREVMAFHKLMNQWGIPSAFFTDSTVYESDEGRWLLLCLDAVISPSETGKVRAAMATPLYGLQAAALDQMTEDSLEFGSHLGRFVEWEQTWQRFGVMTMLSRMFDELNVKPRFLGQLSGERSVTNFLHLAELLHLIERRQGMRPETLVAEFARRRKDRRRAGEEAQLRMESDGDAVTIMTAHKSKGLEFPIVFAPYQGVPDSGRMRNEPAKFHGDDRKLVLNLLGEPSLEPAERERYRKEAEGEEKRLLYVALTRAQAKCYVYVGQLPDKGKGEKTSPCSSLLKAHEDFPSPNVCIRDAAEEEDEIPPIVPERSAAAPVAARVFRGKIRTSGAITSYSGLKSGHPREAEESEEETRPEVIEADEPDPICAFPGGTVAGEFFHDLLEHYTFGMDRPETRRMIDEKLERHGITGAGLTDVVESLLERLAQIPLPDCCTIAEIKDRLAEVEFWLPIRSVPRGALAQVLNTPEAPIPSLEEIEFRQDEGYLRGFIDLLFRCNGKYYLLDWKSNRLGSRERDYTASVIRREMARQAYALQAHLYVLAVDRHLSRTVKSYQYEQHFGGVFYVFLRGLSAEGNGIWGHRPPLAAVDKLRSVLLRDAAQTAAEPMRLL
jgi:exodeoxyribonuclease V beta subunit